MLTTDEVREALKGVEDPEIGINIVDLGLIYDITLDDDGAVHVTYTLTSMGCPAGPMIDDDIKKTLTALEGTSSIKTTVVMQPPWGPDKMSDFARSAMGYF